MKGAIVFWLGWTLALEGQQAPRWTQMHFDAAGFHAQLLTVPGQAYGIEVSTNLINWRAVLAPPMTSATNTVTPVLIPTTAQLIVTTSADGTHATISILFPDGSEVTVPNVPTMNGVIALPPTAATVITGSSSGVIAAPPGGQSSTETIILLPPSRAFFRATIITVIPVPIQGQLVAPAEPGLHP